MDVTGITALVREATGGAVTEADIRARLVEAVVSALVDRIVSGPLMVALLRGAGTEDVAPATPPVDIATE